MVSTRTTTAGRRLSIISAGINHVELPLSELGSAIMDMISGRSFRARQVPCPVHECVFVCLCVCARTRARVVIHSNMNSVLHLSVYYLGASVGVGHTGGISTRFFFFVVLLTFFLLFFWEFYFVVLHDTIVLTFFRFFFLPVCVYRTPRSLMAALWTPGRTFTW